MSTLALTPQWHDAINQVETTEKILGGAAGNANLAAKQLAENILWLKQTIENTSNEPIKVGDIYTTTISHASPAAVTAHHGYGTWQRFAEGSTLVGLSTKSADPADYKTMGNEFGANEHTLTVPQLPSHKHNLDLVSQGSSGVSGIFYGTGDLLAFTPSKGTELSGSDQPHNNIQPSTVVAIWLRTA